MLIRFFKGKCSLGVSYWIFTAIPNYLLSIVAFELTKTNAINMSPIATILILTLPYAIFSSIGLWRSANNHIIATNRSFFPRLCQFLIILGILFRIQTFTSWQEQRDIESKLRYTIQIDPVLKTILIKGYFKTGLSENFRSEISKQAQNNLTTVVLESPGGNIEEARKLSKLIDTFGFNTHVDGICASACTIAFISGKERSMGRSANLGFHSPRTMIKTDSSTAENFLKLEEEKQVKFFKEKGISTSFIDRIFQAKSNDMWYPTKDELVAGNILTSKSDYKLVNNIEVIQGSDDELIKLVVKNIPWIAVIYKNDKASYDGIINSIVVAHKQGLSEIELQGVVAKESKVFIEKAISGASDSHLQKYFNLQIYIYKKLNAIDPILCLKASMPKKFGALQLNQYIGKDKTEELNSTLELMMEDYYLTGEKMKNIQLATNTYQNLKKKNTFSTTDNIAPEQLKGSSDYKKLCDKQIDELMYILQIPQNELGNFLRVSRDLRKQ